MNRSAAVAPKQAAGDDGGPAGLLQPVSKHERDHHAYRRGSFVFESGHGVIRLRLTQTPAPSGLTRGRPRAERKRR